MEEKKFSRTSHHNNNYYHIDLVSTYSKSFKSEHVVGTSFQLSSWKTVLPVKSKCAESVNIILCKKAVPRQTCLCLEYASMCYGRAHAYHYHRQLTRMRTKNFSGRIFKKRPSSNSQLVSQLVS